VPSRWLVALPLMIGACSYPDFAFTPPADGALDTTRPVEDTRIEDTTVPLVDSDVMDSSVDSAGEQDSTVDSITDSRMDTTADSAMKMDSAAPDTKVVDAPVDTSMPRGCAIAHDFCQSFDTATTPTDGWGGSFGTGGSMVLDTTKWTSPSKSLLVSVSTSSATASSMVTKSFTVATSTTVITAEADIMLDAVTYAHTYDVILLKVQRSSAGDGVFLTVGAGGLNLAAQGSSSNRWAVPGITAGKWFHVKMEAVVHPTAGVARLWVDDVLVQNRTSISSAEADDTSRQILVGLFSYLGAQPFKAHFDDVSYDVP
jgi:hypothetical protein